MTAEQIEQFELIEDDPRAEVSADSAAALVRQWRDARAEYGELVSRGFGGALLGVSTSQVAVWCSRGRLSDIQIGKVTAVSLDEILALRQQRIDEDLPVGGKGKKMPSMSEVIRLSLEK